MESLEVEHLCSSVIAVSTTDNVSVSLVSNYQPCKAEVIIPYTLQYLMTTIAYPDTGSVPDHHNKINVKTKQVG